MSNRALMRQMEHWTPKETPGISGGHQSMRPVGLSGRTLSKSSKASFYRAKIRASSFAQIAKARQAHRARGSKSQK